MSCQLIHGCGENYRGKADLIFSQLYGQLDVSQRGTPVILSGFKDRQHAYELWSFAKLRQIGVWGAKKDQAVWTNMRLFPELDLSDLVEDEVKPGFGFFPVELPRRLLAALYAPADTTTETIVDPFMGRGTVGKAVLEFGGNFIGIDKDKSRVRMAELYIGCASL